RGVRVGAWPPSRPYGLPRNRQGDRVRQRGNRETAAGNCREARLRRRRSQLRALRAAEEVRPFSAAATGRFAAAESVGASQQILSVLKRRVGNLDATLHAREFASTLRRVQHLDCGEGASAARMLADAVVVVPL